MEKRILFVFISIILISLASAQTHPASEVLTESYSGEEGQLSSLIINNELLSGSQTSYDNYQLSKTDPGHYADEIYVNLPGQTGYYNFQDLVKSCGTSSSTILPQWHHLGSEIKFSDGSSLQDKINAGNFFDECQTSSIIPEVSTIPPANLVTPSEIRDLAITQNEYHLLFLGGNGANSYFLERSYQFDTDTLINTIGVQFVSNPTPPGDMRLAFNIVSDGTIMYTTKNNGLDSIELYSRDQGSSCTGTSVVNHLGEYNCYFGNFNTGFVDDARLAIDSQKNIYVYEYEKNQIKVFKPKVNYVCPSGTTNAGERYCYDRQITTATNIIDVFVDYSDNALYAVENFENRIKKIRLSDGAVLGCMGKGTAGIHSCSSSSGSILFYQFNEPQEVAVDSSQNIWITDYEHHVVKKLDSNGNFLGCIGGTGSSFITNINQCDSFSSASNPTGFSVNYPTLLKFDSNGNMYVGVREKQGSQTPYATNTIKRFKASAIGY